MALRHLLSAVLLLSATLATVEDDNVIRPVTDRFGFKLENVGVKILDSVNNTLGSEEELKHAVGLVRPVSVAFEFVTGFRFHMNGDYTRDTWGKPPMDVNHAVLAVGYGAENGIAYWLNNTWGGDWGDNGYFKMDFGKNI
ncbi:oryzain gamma chain-like [Phalaenopsis equestris]|uniref:oryzain gamma chain-like n=1 Tax=Phalaenopsis equestris TaxID=78828 RepID=UPI0009E2245F|nr:oryzain gamma chain-like [Phalaenopsis equestris]